MSTHISIATQPTNRTDVLAVARHVTGRGIGEVKHQLATGAPLLEGELFGDEGFDDKARRLAEGLESIGVPVEIRIGARVVTREVLENMLRNFAEEVERQGKLMNEEADE
jgi:hypothetical protein